MEKSTTQTTSKGPLTFLEVGTEQQLDFLRDWQHKLWSAGFLGMHWPTKYGGQGSDAAFQGIVDKALTAHNAPIIFNTIGLNWTGPLLLDVGTEEDRQRYIKNILTGDEIWCQGFSEPDHGSDLGNVQTKAVRDGDEWVINGSKHYISGAGDSRCKILITMVVTNPDAPKHLRQSQILVPKDTPGLTVVRPMKVFGHDHAPHGHMHITFEDVRVPKSNIILGEGRGFEISQGRLGPGRIHHCMRSIGVAERALELMCKRALTRTAFGKPLAELGGNYDVIADSRIEIDQCRLAVLKAAHMMDEIGNKEARKYISAIKVSVPNMALRVIDRAIQMYGALGVSQDTPLAGMWMGQRTLRLADGPDEVHRRVIAREELKQYS